MNTFRFSTFREWLKKTYTEEDLRVIVEYGCKHGFKDSTYTWELVAMYKNYKEELWDILKSWATYQEMPVLTLIGHYNKVNNQGEIEHAEAFECACVWVAAQMVAQGWPRKRWHIREVDMHCIEGFVVFRRSDGERSRHYYPSGASMKRLLHAMQDQIACNEGRIYVRKHGWRWVA